MEKHKNVRLAPTWYIVRRKKYFDIRRTTIEISQISKYYGCDQSCKIK